MESWHHGPPDRKRGCPRREPVHHDAMTGQRISARIAAVSPSATLAVDAKAKLLKAQGESVMGFGAGEPDFPTPEHIVAAAEAACHDPRSHKYTPTAGLPELREAVAVKTRRDSGLEVTASQILVTNGGKQAIANSFAVLCDPGDEVLVPGALLDHLSGGHRPRRWCSCGRSRPMWPVVSGPPSNSSDGGSNISHQDACCSCRLPTPPAPSIPATRSRQSDNGRWSRPVGAHRRDL